MATNEILPFCTVDTGTNLLTQPEYDADGQRVIGNQPGPPPARSKLVNKCLRQTSIISAGFGQFLSEYQNANVVDGLSEAQISQIIFDAINNSTQNIYTVATGTANAIILTPAFPVTSYDEGDRFRFKAAFNNTGPVTINISGLGAKIANEASILGLLPLKSSQIVAGQIYEIIYDGVEFQVENLAASTTFSASVTFNANTTQTINGNSSDKVQFDLIESDEFGWWSPSNFRFTPTIPGKYNIYSCVGCASTGGTQALYLNKNNSRIKILSQTANTTIPSKSAPSGAIGSVTANGITDYFDVDFENETGGATQIGDESGNVGTSSYFIIEFAGV
jgi:hypothetical protein